MFKGFNKNSILIALVVFFMLMAFGLIKPNVVFAVATAPTLGDAASFAVLGATTVTNTGSTVLNGDLGLYSGTSIIGFFRTTANEGPGVVTAEYNVHQTDATASLAQTAATSAYNAMASQSCGGNDLSGQNLGGMTLTPGVYCFTSSAQLTGTLTLNAQGNPNAVWVFQIGTTLTTATNSSVVFSNGGSGTPGCNVFWQVGTAATLGSGTTFVGTIIAHTEAITLVTGATLYGRALSSAAAVTLDTNTVTVPACVATNPSLTLEKIVVKDNGGTADESAWILSAAGPTNISGTMGSSAVTNATVTAGLYTLSESLVPSGYIPSSWSCTNGTTVSSGQITLGAGQSTVCTITNNDVAPQLVVAKVVVGGGKGISDFPLFIDGFSVESGVASTTSVGLHTVSETADSTYTSNIGGDCASNGTITLAPGEVKSCTITNNYVNIVPYQSGGSSISYAPPVPPLIDVVKVSSLLALPAGSGAVTYTYTLRNIGIVPVANITMVGNTCSPITLVSGDTNADARLDVTETYVYSCSTALAATHTNTVVATGWANGISATDIASATVVVGIPIVPPLIHVVKVPSPLTPVAGGGAVTYTYTVTNPGTEPLSNVTITDDKCTGLPGRVLGHPGDLNKNNLLESNEIWTFACKSKLTKTTTNTAIASGEANGLIARDFAIATVVVAASVPSATITPALPGAGLPPEGESIPWGMVILVGIFISISTSFFILLKNV